MKGHLISWGLVGALAFAITWFLQSPGRTRIVVGPDLGAPGPISVRQGELATPQESAPGEIRVLEPQRPDPLSTPAVDEWAAYEASSIQDLEFERDRLIASLNVEATPLLREQVVRGQAERIADPGEFTYHSRPEDKTDILGIVNNPELGVFRACLSRSQFPDLYEVKSRILNLDALISSKKREARE